MEPGQHSSLKDPDLFLVLLDRRVPAAVVGADADHVPGEHLAPGLKVAVGLEKTECNHRKSSDSAAHWT